MKELPGYFSLEEISCKCGCGRCVIQPSFYFKMNWLRSLLGIPLHITSWNRCPVHNKKEGGSKTSSHLIGWACDQQAFGQVEKYRIIFFAGIIGFRGIGIGETFIHLDDDPCKPINRIWTY